MTSWMILTSIYALSNGMFQCAKKKSLQKNDTFEVLAWFSIVAFFISIFMSPDAFKISFESFCLVTFKSFIILIAWFCSLYALNVIDISLYSVLNLFRIISSITLSVIFLNEKLDARTAIGGFIVLLGLFLVNVDFSKLKNNKLNNNAKEKNEVETKKHTSAIILIIISCILNSTSAIIDKKAMFMMTSSQLQFWFLFFLALGYWVTLILKKCKNKNENRTKLKEIFDIRILKNNKWILIAGLCLVFGDKCLFIANGDAESKVVVITLLKQIATIESIILGKIIFKEKNIMKKLLCSFLIIAGIVLTVI